MKYIRYFESDYFKDEVMDVFQEVVDEFGIKMHDSGIPPKQFSDL